MSEKHSHNHEEIGQNNSKMLLWSLLIAIIFMVVEVIAGIISGSLTLLADAGHMFTDAFAIFLSWFAILMSRKPKDLSKTYGYYRFEVIATFVNGVSLLALTIWIIYEAIYRMYDTSPVDGKILFYVGIIGFIANLVMFLIIRNGDHEDMNIKSALLSTLSDVVGSLAAVIAGLIIIFTGKVIADPLLSLFVSLLLLKATFRLIRKSLHILMEGTPEELDIANIKEVLIGSISEIKDLHHIHIWSLKAKKHYITFHIVIDIAQDSQKILSKTKNILHDKFGIEHSTIQVEYKECMDREC